MKAIHATLVALVAAIMLTSVAAAGPEAAKQRVVITSGASQPTQVGAPFVLTPLRAGALKRDSGTLTASASGRTVMRDGQRIEIYVNVGTYKGKLGNLVTRHRTEYVDGGNGYHVGTGTWTVVRGTGQYAQITGGGRSGTVWLDRGPWSFRSEGFLTVP